jgi:hypothetical protein
MEKTILTTDHIRLNLLEKCFNLGLPASSRDDINTLKMYLEVDSKLDVESFEFHVENEIKKKSGIKSLILKMFSIYKS